MTNSVNDVKQAKAVQVVTDERACELLRNIRMDIQDFGGLREIKRITKNFAYSLSEAKPTDDAIPAVKVGKKCFYLFSVGQVNETNILNVIKSILKVEDAKRVFAKRLAKRLDFAAFCETKETVTRIECMKDGARLVGLELTDKQIKEAKHHLYNEYLQSLGLDE